MAVIVGLDMATLKAGYGVIESDGRTHRYLECGLLTAPEKWSRNRRLISIATDLGALLRDFKPDEVAIEEAYVGKHPASALALGEIRGAAIMVAAGCGLQLTGYAPTTIKAAVAGGKASKAEVQRAVALLLGLRREAGEDESDALACALCHASRIRFRKALQKATT